MKTTSLTELREALERRDRAHQEDDGALARRFAERAEEVRAQLEFLTGGGLQEGTEEALSSMAEQDMTDFCLMVDLAEGVAIQGVQPLSPGTRETVRQFLQHEPWHTLAVDNDVTVLIAMVEEVMLRGDDAIRGGDLPHVAADVLDRVNEEQFGRFLGEIETLHETGATLPDAAAERLDFLTHRTAERLGLEPPKLPTAQ